MHLVCNSCWWRWMLCCHLCIVGRGESALSPGLQPHGGFRKVPRLGAFTRRKLRAQIAAKTPAVFSARDIASLKPVFEHWKWGSPAFRKKCDEHDGINTKTQRTTPCFEFFMMNAWEKMHIGANRTKPCEQIKFEPSLPTEEFFQRADSANGVGEWLYGGFDWGFKPYEYTRGKRTPKDKMSWNSAFQADIFEAEHEFCIGDCAGTSRHAVWISSKGVIANAHYDYGNNIFTQVSGAKRFILFPPDAVADLHLFPSRLHPSRRQSQVDFTELLGGGGQGVNQTILTELLVRFPSLGAALEAATEAVLNEGDVLFIPSHTAHFVYAAEPSISYSMNLNGADRDFDKHSESNTYDKINSGITRIMAQLMNPAMSKSTKKEGGSSISVGARVLGVFAVEGESSGNTYPATVAEVHDGGAEYTLNWEDGDRGRRRQPAANVRKEWSPQLAVAAAAGRELVARTMEALGANGLDVKPRADMAREHYEKTFSPLVDWTRMRVAPPSFSEAYWCAPTEVDHDLIVQGGTELADILSTLTPAVATIGANRIADEIANELLNAGHLSVGTAATFIRAVSICPSLRKQAHEAPAAAETSPAAAEKETVVEEPGRLSTEQKAKAREQNTGWSRAEASEGVDSSSHVPREKFEELEQRCKLVEEENSRLRTQMKQIVEDIVDILPDI